MSGAVQFFLTVFVPVVVELKSVYVTTHRTKDVLFSVSVASRWLLL
jgi:hypothetical protein